MVTEKKRKISKIVSIIVMFSGLSIILGWIFDINMLKRILPLWTPVEFSTAISFVLSGIILYFIVKATEGEFDKAQIFLSISSLIVTLFIGILFFSAVFKIHTGIEKLFIKTSPDMTKISFPVVPPIPVMINFILVSIAGTMTPLNPKKLKSKLRTIGLVIASIGILSIISYILDLPGLYYYIEGINSVIACYTSVLFVLLGLGFVCL